MIFITKPVENGMFAGAELYDTQCQQQHLTKCTECKELVPEYEIKYFNDGACVCEDCLNVYAKKNSQEFVQDFFAENKEERVKYLKEWWFDTLEKEEQQEILEKAYQSIRQNKCSIMNQGLTENEWEFCLDADCFLEYVEENL